MVYMEYSYPADHHRSRYRHVARLSDPGRTAVFWQQKGTFSTHQVTLVTEFDAAQVHDGFLHGSFDLLAYVAIVGSVVQGCADTDGQMQKVPVSPIWAPVMVGAFSGKPVVDMEPPIALGDRFVGFVVTVWTG